MLKSILPVLLLLPFSTHAINFVPSKKSDQPRDTAIDTKQPKHTPTKTNDKGVEKPKAPVESVKTSAVKNTPIERWQWDIYEKHKVPVPYRFILEVIRMNECNQPGGLCYRSYRKNLATACKNPKRATGDGGIFQMNYIHGEIFDKTMEDLCKMREAIKEKDDKKFIKWRDKLFEDQMLWTLVRSKDILENKKLGWEEKVRQASWRHHSNPSKAKNIRYSQKAVANWRKITKGQDFLK